MTIKIIIDATNATLGRLSSYAAKQSLLGKEVIIVNCDNAIITGDQRMVINEYKEKRSKGGHSLKGPHFPKEPQKLVKRTIRGMLSYKQGRGLAALKRILCYNKVPQEYETVGKIMAGKEKAGAKISLLKLSQEI